jgi:hypothetical protein
MGSKAWLKAINARNHPKPDEMDVRAKYTAAL